MKCFIAGSLLLGCMLLSACGGGGSGGGGSGGVSVGTLSVSATTLTYIANGPSGATPAPQVVNGTVSGVSSGTLYITIVGNGPAIKSISPVTIQNNTGQASVSVPVPSSLAVGTYTGMITVRACLNDATCASGELNGSPQTISVTYHVAALQSSAASLDYTITNTPIASDLSRQATITGIPVQTWSATTNANWLTVTGTGNSGAAMNASLQQSTVDGMTNGIYTGSITLTPGTAGQPLVIPVSLTIKRTQINYVSPYVAYSGSSNNVIIRGEEFSQVTIQNVLFGTTAAQSFTVVSPTEIHATYPSSLAKGRYAAALQSNFASVRQLAELVVVDAPAFSAAALSYPDTQEKTVNTIFYDAERAAIGVSIWYPFTGATAFVRFPSTANVWQTATAKSIANSFGAVLSADGTEWIAGNDKSIMHLRADDLTSVATVPSLLNGNSTQTLAEMAVANDGTVAVFGDVYFNCGADLMLYNVRKRMFIESGYTACRGDIGAAGDGSRLLIPNESTSFSSDDVFSLDTSAHTTTPTGIHLLTNAEPAFDRTGSRVVLNRTQIYDGSYTYLGALPATTDAVVLRPDGMRAYAFDHSGLLMTYDLASAPVAGVFQKIGADITLAGDPGPISNPSSTAPPFSGAVVMMSITPDGKNVFIVGTKAVIVQPVP